MNWYKTYLPYSISQAKYRCLIFNISHPDLMKANGLQDLNKGREKKHIIKGKMQVICVNHYQFNYCLVKNNKLKLKTKHIKPNGEWLLLNTLLFDRCSFHSAIVFSLLVHHRQFCNLSLCPERNFFILQSTKNMTRLERHISSKSS